jgi:hypothetical protein
MLKRYKRLSWRGYVFEVCRVSFPPGGVEWASDARKATCLPMAEPELVTHCSVKSNRCPGTLDDDRARSFCSLRIFFLYIVLSEITSQSLLFGIEIGIVHGREIRDAFFGLFTSMCKNNLDPIFQRNSVQEIHHSEFEILA